MFLQIIKYACARAKAAGWVGSQPKISKKKQIIFVLHQFFRDPKQF